MNSKSDRSERTVSRGGVQVIFLSVLFLLFISAVPAGLYTGAVDISFNDIINFLFSAGDRTSGFILGSIRMPRMVLAFLVGASLAVSGAVFQCLLINPLADSYTTGVSAGAAFGAASAIILGFSGFILPLSAIIASALTLLLVLILSSRSGGLEPRNLVLSGIVVSAVLSAALSLLKSISGDSLSTLIFWLLGSFAGRSWDEVFIFLPYFIIAVFIIFFKYRELDILSFGREQAEAIGVDVKKNRYILILSAAALASVSVAVSGIIGFIGLVVPHILRAVFGASHRKLLPFSFLFGGILLVWADILVRSLSAYGEVPVGSVTALIGGPFFCYLLIAGRTK